MDKKTKILISIVALLVLITAIASYLRIFVLYDYGVVPLEETIIE